LSNDVADGIVFFCFDRVETLEYIDAVQDEKTLTVMIDREVIKGKLQR
jgi:hypothetical protein